MPRKDRKLSPRVIRELKSRMELAVEREVTETRLAFRRDHSLPYGLTERAFKKHN